MNNDVNGQISSCNINCYKHLRFLISSR